MISGKIGDLALGDDRPVRVMGVINLTENSFYSGSVARSEGEIRKVALKMVREGADIIDVGARSTAPYRTSEVSVETESRLIARALKILTKTVELPISVDTTRYPVAEIALNSGAIMLNDVYGFTQPGASKLAETVEKSDAFLLTSAHDRLEEGHTGPLSAVLSCLENSLKFAKNHGIRSDKIIIDPGIGFFSDRKISNADWNTTVLAKLSELKIFKRPICVGVSRKSFIGSLLGQKDPNQRLNGSLSATAIAVYNGAHLIRTHDVLATSEVIKVASSLREKRFNPPRD